MFLSSLVNIILYMPISGCSLRQISKQKIYHRILETSYTWTTFYNSKDPKTVRIHFGSVTICFSVYTGNGAKSVPDYTGNCVETCSTQLPRLRAGIMVNQPRDEKLYFLVSDPHQFGSVPVVYTQPQLERIQSGTPWKVIPNWYG